MTQANIIIIRKPLQSASCAACRKGVMMPMHLSRLETGLGHEGHQCDCCHRKVKYVPAPESPPDPTDGSEI